MSDLAELKKLMEGNTKAISALIQAEANSDRIKNEIASNMRVLEGLHEKISIAKADLETAKADAVRIQADAKKHIDELLSSASVAKIEEERRLASAKTLERQAQTKLDEASALKEQYSFLVANVTAQKEKLKAALV